MRLALLIALLLAAPANSATTGLPAMCGKVELKDGRVIEGACIVLERHLDALFEDYKALADRAEAAQDKAARCSKYRRT